MPKTAKPTAQVVLDALAARPDATAVELAALTGLGRSTVSKALAELERKRRVRRRTDRRQGSRRRASRWSLTSTRKRSSAGRKVTGRLRPGQLDGLVLEYLGEHADDGPLGPTAVAKGLGRSSGAVANCLARLARDGQVRKVGERPRRYQVR